MAGFLALLFGLIIGSFLNVCIYRWPRDLSIVRPRSQCIACQKTIAWYDNVPLLSYVLLGGRCRHCGARIPLRYPLVELVTGLAFFSFVWTLGPTPAAFKMCVFAALLVGLIFSDLEKRILPDQLTLGGALAGMVFSIFVPLPESIVGLLLPRMEGPASDRVESILEAAVGAALPALVLWVAGWVYQLVRHREGLGLGDVKLIAMAGTFLGFGGALFTLMLGSIAGSVIGYGYIRATGKDSSTYELPFGSFLGAAALVIALAGNKLG